MAAAGAAVVSRRRWGLSALDGGIGGTVAVGLTILFGIVALVLFSAAAFGDVGIRIWGLDIGHYLDATRRWVDTGSPYLPSEVAAPFNYQPLTFLHPPIALLLFAPFLVLPAPLWWLPLAVVAWCVASWRPERWTWPIIAAVLAFPRVHVAIIVGNTDLWIWAAIALGLRYGWPAVLVVIKPTLIPLIVVGARRRSLFIALPVVALLCLPFGSLWMEWIHVAVNAPGGVLYSIQSLPWLLIPVLAYATRRSPAPTGDRATADWS
jgi:hypothetical protein